MMKQVLVGLPDSGIDSSLGDHVAAGQRFALDENDDVQTLPAADDSAGHGTAVARIIASTAPQARILNAQVFADGTPSSTAAIAAGLGWLVTQGAEIVNMSFGLRADRKILRDACLAASKAGVLLVAAVPAQGGTVYPAAYPDVIRVTGDARCAAGELSRLDDNDASFGACPGPIGHVPHQRGAGSSLAVAHVTAKLANYLSAGGASADALSYLSAECTFFGREHHR